MGMAPEVTVWDRLRKRELQLVKMLAEGHTSKSISAELHITPATVKRHLWKAFNTLGCSTRAELVSWWAVREHWQLEQRVRELEFENRTLRRVQHHLGGGNAGRQA